MRPSSVLHCFQPQGPESCDGSKGLSRLSAKEPGLIRMWDGLERYLLAGLKGHSARASTCLRPNKLGQLETFQLLSQGASLHHQGHHRLLRLRTGLVSHQTAKLQGLWQVAMTFRKVCSSSSVMASMEATRSFCMMRLDSRRASLVLGPHASLCPAAGAASPGVSRTPPPHPPPAASSEPLSSLFLPCCWAPPPCKDPT